MRGEHAWLETGIISMIDDHAANASRTTQAREAAVAQLL